MNAGTRSLILLFATAAAGCTSVRPASAPVPSPDSLRIRQDIAHLASDRLEGRRAGTPGNDSAAAYIARRYQLLGLDGMTPVSYLQPFVARPAPVPIRRPKSCRPRT